MTDQAGKTIPAQTLTELAEGAECAKRLPPVDTWDPPYCGDVGLAILRDGTWHYRESPIRRPALVALFASILRCDDDGRHYLVTPVEKVDVSVADAPFLAVEMEVEHPGETTQRIMFRTNLGDIAPCGPAYPLRFDLTTEGGLKPYVRVRGRLEARLTRALVYDLVALAVAGSDGLGVWSAGMWFALPDSSS